MLVDRRMLGFVFTLMTVVAGVPGAQVPQRTCPPLERAALERALGREVAPGPDGAFKVTVAQNDLDVRVDDVRIIPPMGLGSWAAFAPACDGSGAIVMGDIVVRETEILPVQRALLAHGLTVSGLHNHFVRESVPVMFMHIHGVGAPDSLARGVRAALERIAALRGGDPSRAPAASVATTLDTTAVRRALGHGGEWSRGVYKVTIGRPDIRLVEHGTPVTSFMGFNTWAAFQGSAEQAAVAGDFAMTAAEVPAVIAALVEGGIEVVAVHNHMTGESPPIYFLHYWGKGPAASLAATLRTALGRAGTPPPGR